MAVLGAALEPLRIEYEHQTVDPVHLGRPPDGVDASVDYLPDESWAEDLVHGPSEEVLEDLDIRESFNIDIHIDVSPAYPKSYRAEVRFRRSGTAAGVEIEVYSNTDRRWGQDLYRNLEREIQLGVNCWSWLHTSLGRKIFSAFHGLAAAAAVYPVALWISESQLAATVTTLVVSGVIAISARTPNWQAFLLPHFEIIPIGVKPRGTRLLIAISSLLAGTILGTLASIWLLLYNSS